MMQSTQTLGEQSLAKQCIWTLEEQSLPNNAVKLWENNLLLNTTVKLWENSPLPNDANFGRTIPCQNNTVKLWENNPLPNNAVELERMIPCQTMQSNWGRIIPCQTMQSNLGRTVPCQTLKQSPAKRCNWTHISQHWTSWPTPPPAPFVLHGCFGFHEDSLVSWFSFLSSQIFPKVAQHLDDTKAALCNAFLLLDLQAEWVEWAVRFVKGSIFTVTASPVLNEDGHHHVPWPCSLVQLHTQSLTQSCAVWPSRVQSDPVVCKLSLYSWFIFWSSWGR